MMEINKKELLSLGTKEKFKILDRLVNKDFNSYVVLANIFSEAKIDEGGLSSRVLERELNRSIKRSYYFKNKKEKDDKRNIACD
jgi:hypothetical protein